MLVVLLKEVMESSYQLRVIQMVLEHLGGREQDFKEQSWRLRVKKGGLSDLTTALKKNAHL